MVQAQRASNDSRHRYPKPVGGGGGGGTPLNLGWGCAAGCLRTSPCSRLNQENRYPVPDWKTWDAVDLLIGNGVFEWTWSGNSNKRSFVPRFWQQNSCPRPCSRVGMAKVYPVPDRNADLWTLFQTQRGKNHTLLSGTSPYSPYMGVPPPPPGPKQFEGVENQWLTLSLWSISYFPCSLTRTHTVRRTWLFVAYSEDDYTTIIITSLIHLSVKTIGEWAFWPWYSST